MTSTVESLPLKETLAPSEQAGVTEAVRAAYDRRQAVYPLGGQTSLDYGISAQREGLGLELTGLSAVVDYTPRDMTIVVEAGVRMADLAVTLAAEGQHLPIDVPRAAEATLGGAVATNWSGPRRYGCGTFRDYIIGIHAVDGRGVAFKGGGRVVKNVAGYDFCKLLCGSLGTLGVVTQLAFKVRPLPQANAAVVVDCQALDDVEHALARLVELPAVPLSIDLVVGSAWRETPWLATGGAAVAAIIAHIAGSETEVAWLGDQLASTLTIGGGQNPRVLQDTAADELLAEQIAFADRGLAEAGDESPLVLKITARPSAVTQLVAQLLSIDANCTLQAHAGSGIILARFSALDSIDPVQMIVSQLRPAAIGHGGSVTVVSTTLDGLTPHVIWGPRSEATVLMERIKQQFDPQDILNPGRFVY